jgi:glycosyltransferase involved in cell wall biosynthesis
MRVLYILWNYPQISETYIATEIAFAQKCGIEVHVWSQINYHPDLASQCMVHRGTLTETIAAVGPDLIHIHYLVVAKRHLHEIPPGIPVTIRGHSFDWNPSLAKEMGDQPTVKRLYLFPHFVAAMGGHTKAFALPVAYDTTLHPPAVCKDRNLVVRLAAGLPTKGLDDVLAVANRCPDFRFILGISRAGGGEQFLEHITRLNGYVKDRVQILIDLHPQIAADINRRAGIYLYTHDHKGPAFGMPTSIAEAMATGSYVLSLDVPAARSYISEGGAFYKNPEEAAKLIQATKAWTEEDWGRISATAIQRAGCFRDDVVLSHLIQDWRALTVRA